MRSLFYWTIRCATFGLAVYIGAIMLPQIASTMMVGSGNPGEVFAFMTGTIFGLVAAGVLWLIWLWSGFIAHGIASKEGMTFSTKDPG